jgi:outer membrane protein OmpA-like peptidoglycan-associated protein
MKKKDRERLLRTIREPLVGFAPRQTSLNSTQKAKLNQKVTAWKKMQDVKLVCYGYTSDLGDEALSVGLKRAQAVKNYLVQKGISKNKISVVSRGAESPLVPNINMANRNMNSRVEIVEK